ncbi:hypothetical protein V2J09_020515 [Rumex salicifolius]
MEVEDPFSDDNNHPLIEDNNNNNNQLNKEEKKGGWRAVKYILVNETFEKLASMSLTANITVYFRTKYNMEGILLVNVISIWSGSSNILSIVGALLSDACLGRFYTLLIGSIASLLGMGGMTLTSAIPKIRPPKCDQRSDCSEPGKWQLGILFTSLGLLAVGSGCIRPCNIAFGADQFNQRTNKGRVQLQCFYNWWYFSFTIALLLALTVVVYIQTNISWVLGFAIPTCCFVISITCLLIGCHTYIYNKPQGSIFIDMVKVVVAACRKRRLSLNPHEAHPFYNPSPSDPFGIELNRTRRLCFFEKAALISHPDELTHEGLPAKTWSLCSIQQVEQLKSLIGILPVWVTSILSFEAMDQQNTFGILQAIQMNRKVGSQFTIPPGWIGLASMLTLSLWILIYERLIIPLLRKIRKSEDARLSVKLRIQIGIIMSIASMLVASFVEKCRRNAAIKVGSFISPLSIWYLVPQLALSGMVEAFAAVAILEFFTTQMPESMRSIAGSMFFLSVSMASYMSSGLVNVIYKLTKNGEGQAWLGGQDLNKNRLDYFYLLVTAVGALNLLYFSLFAGKYIFISDCSGGSTNTIGLTAIERQA